MIQMCIVQSSEFKCVLLCILCVFDTIYGHSDTLIYRIYFIYSHLHHIIHLSEFICLSYAVCLAVGRQAGKCKRASM